MTNEEMVVLVTILAAAYFFFAGCLAFRRSRQYQRVYRTERTRAHWARARIELFGLVESEKLSPRSETFKEFYRVQTFILRRPDEYGSIAKAMARVFLESPSPTPAVWLKKEKQDWPSDMDSVLRNMSLGTNSLIWMHAGWGRISFFLTIARSPSGRRLAWWVSKHQGNRLLALLYGILPRIEPTLILDQAQVALSRLSADLKAQPLGGKLGPPAVQPTQMSVARG